MNQDELQATGQFEVKEFELVQAPKPHNGAGLIATPTRTINAYIDNGNVVATEQEVVCGLVSRDDIPANAKAVQIDLNFDNIRREIGGDLASNICDAWDGVSAPGFLGLLSDDILKRSFMPQRELAVAAALSTIAVIAGRHIMSPTGTSLSLLVLMLAGTGAGKNDPMKAPGRYLKAAGLGHCIGSGMYMSRSAIYEELLENPRLHAPVDEAGSFFDKITNPKASNHELGIASIMRDAYTANFDQLTGVRWAGRGDKGVIAPHFCFHGASTVEQFFSALSLATVEDGTINRLLIFWAKGYVEMNPNRLDKQDMPDHIIGRLEAINNIGGAHDGIPMVDNCEVDPTQYDWLTRMSFGTDAEHFFNGIQRWQTNEIIRNPSLAALIQRTAEKALRLASIVAIADLRKAVEVEDLIWGINVSLATLATTLRGVSENVASTDFQRDCNRILRGVKKHGSRTRSEIQKAGRMKGQYLNECLSALMESGDIIATEFTSEAGGTVTRYTSH